MKKLTCINLKVSLKKGKNNMVCRLKKNLYGFKQTPRQWYRSLKASCTRKVSRSEMLTIVFSLRDVNLVISFCYFMLMICQ